MDKRIIETFKLIQKKVDDIDISERVGSEIDILMNQELKIRKKVPFAVKFALVSVLIFIIIILYSPFSINKVLKDIDSSSIEKMTLQYAKISGKETQKYYFKSDNKNKTIVWIQKKGE